MVRKRFIWLIVVARKSKYFKLLLTIFMTILFYAYIEDIHPRGFGNNEAIKVDYKR